MNLNDNIPYLNNNQTFETGFTFRNYEMPAGRPSAPTKICPDNDILSLDEIKEDRPRLITLGEEPAIKWLARRGLIRNTMQCPQCNIPCSLVNDNGIDGRKWKCRLCSRNRSVRIDSFFFRSHLSLSQLIVVLYCWAYDFPQTQALRECGIQDNGHTLPDWYNFCRDMCQKYLEENPSEIGGMDPNTGEPIDVEIDESMFFKRKYNVGNHLHGHWVFGGIERDSGKCFLVRVADRGRHTLEEAIRRFILPGSHIISDGWAAYAHVEEIDHGIYTHSTVIHDQNFVDPSDNRTHTQNIEGMWMHAKAKLRRQRGTSDSLFDSYLVEFMWRCHFREWDQFAAIIYCIRRYYCL